ncbi:unnamed protein product [Chironomus riparius]|uniref:Aftiphilin clathrin-binding box domain-containing protein n=1 Tax=Chironomus riparius TaxID=315576 RepID=A0A9P0NI23_9DIPT|nr:unnamed protein product [Chironomus riparius]
MSVYDCEPPQLDCDLPPPDEEISSKRKDHENDFDLDDEELSSYRTIKEHSTITNNVLHLYDSSPPPVDDFFIHKTSYEADELEIPEIEVEMDEIENIHHPVSVAEVNDLENTVPKDETITEEVINPPNLESTEGIEIQSSIEHKTDLELTSNNNNGDIKDTTHKVNDFTLEDMPEDDDDGWGDDIETTVVNILEKLPEVHIEESLQNINDDDDDDEFDNFNDFEQAIPIDRHIEQQISIEKTVVDEPNEFQFEADFSAFEVNFDNQFQSFSNSNEGQEFHTSIEKTTAVIDDETFLNETNNDNDDDDFGDFNDFEHQGPSQDTLIAQQEIQYTQQTLSILDDSEVKTILSEMFPVNKIEADDSTTYPIIHKDKGNENDMKIVNDVESTLALTYDYKDSSTNHILIKALGIDERNILFGPQWAASNMPRFASDLSFNPLEPAKFASSSTSYRTNSTVNSSIISKAKDKDIEKVSKEAQPDIVPEFDWSVAGLTNPLDGKQANTLKPNEESSLPYELGSAFDATQKIAEVVGSDIDNSLTKHIWQSERFEVANTIVRERTIKLPETHIFTPIKSISPVAREVSRESSPIENDKDKRSVVIKEYHDVEYSLESSKKTDQDSDFGDFNDFQSAINDVPIQPLKPAVAATILLPTNVLEPQKLSVLEPQKVIESKQSEIISNTAVNEHEFMPKTVTNFPNQVSNYDVFAELAKAPSKTIEAQKKSIEDDFADFQAAPIILPQKVPIERLQHQPLFREDSSLTLSPSRLANSMHKMSESSQGHQKVTSWMHDSLDSDEISRIEAAFPKCKVDIKKKQHADDDEWCDFQSVSQSLNQVPNHTSDNKKMNSSDNNADTSDWSDFVSVPIVKPSINASQFLSKPNFPSWNQPSKPYVNHTTSFLSSNNSHYDQSFYARTKQPMTITNNFNYTFERQEVSTVSPYQMSNGISTILPDLQFALPKTLINLSRGNGSDTTKK